MRPREPAVPLGAPRAVRPWGLDAPAGGVLLHEHIDDAAWRCLDEEVGLRVDDASRRRHLATLRDTRFIGRVDLPPDRHGERKVADDVGDGPLGLFVMRSKAYWLTTLLFRAQSDVAAIANGREVDAVEWCSLDEARLRFRETARPEKAEIMEEALTHAERTFPATGPSDRWHPDQFIVHGRFCDPAFIVAELERLRVFRDSDAVILLVYRGDTVFRPLLRIVHRDHRRTVDAQATLTDRTRFSAVTR